MATTDTLSLIKQFLAEHRDIPQALTELLVNILTAIDCMEDGVEAGEEVKENISAKAPAEHKKGKKQDKKKKGSKGSKGRALAQLQASALEAIAAMNCNFPRDTFWGSLIAEPL